MADVNRGNRPLSPFMIGQYYRPQMTSISSIMVRITAIACLGISALLVLWLLAAATSDAAFEWMDWLMRGFLGDLILLGGTWAIWYHMLGRLRHVFWDLGYFLEVEISEKLGLIMFILATALTVFTVVVV